MRNALVRLAYGYSQVDEHRLFERDDHDGEVHSSCLPVPVGIDDGVLDRPPLSGPV